MRPAGFNERPHVLHPGMVRVPEDLREAVRRKIAAHGMNRTMLMLRSSETVLGRIVDLGLARPVVIERLRARPWLW